MNYKCALTIVGLTGALALPLPAVAQLKAYAGASLGGMDAKDFCDHNNSSTTACDKTGTAWRVFAGVHFTPNLGAEIAYVNLGKVTANDSATGINTKIENQASEAVAVLRYPLRQLSLFGKVGGYYARTKSAVESSTGATFGREANGGLTYGLGAQYDFTQQLGLRADWQRYAQVGGSSTGGETDIDAWLLGLVWNFQ